MGYQLHIRRERGLPDEQQVTEQEWDDLVGSRTDFERLAELRGTNPATGAVITIPGPIWTWTAHPDGHPIYLSYVRGRIQAKNPDDPTIHIMKELARALGGFVEGDEGERY